MLGVRDHILCGLDYYHFRRNEYATGRLRIADMLLSRRFELFIVKYEPVEIGYIGKYRIGVRKSRKQGYTVYGKDKKGGPLQEYDNQSERTLLSARLTCRLHVIMGKVRESGLSYVLFVSLITAIVLG